MESELKRLFEILESHSFDVNLFEQPLHLKEWSQFFDIFLRGLSSISEKGRTLPLDCFLDMCLEIANFDSVHQDTALKDIIGLIDAFVPTNKSVSLLFDWLRTSSRAWTHDTVTNKLSPEFHRCILDRIVSKVADDNPDHIIFNGQPDCFIEVSSIPWTFSNGFTLAYWIKIPTIVPNKSFELFRCKSPLLSIEVVLLAKTEAGIYSVRVVSSSEKRGRDELRGDILITSGQWHYVTVKYLGGSGPTSNTISIGVDGSSLLDAKLTYPVVSQSLETLWTFGSSFQGLISSITLFSGEVNQNYLHFLHSLGPYVVDFGKGSSTPQSSYDSGFTPLGTLFTKGPWTKVHKLPRIFCLNSMTVRSNFTLSLSKAGRQFQDFVSFASSQKQDSDQSFMVGLHGKCSTVQGISWMEHLYNCGGVSLLMYLFWTYSTKYGKLDLSSNLHIKASMQKMLFLLQQLISNHVDMKEQFLQLHGFHLLAHCLYRPSLDSKENDIIDGSLIGSAVEVVIALGLDATKGDGGAAALQGLLFDFRLWSQTNLTNLKLVLEAAGGVAHGAGDQLFNAIGIQRLLDIVRVHLSKHLTISAKHTEDSKALAVDCADEILRMLIIMKDSAHMHAQKQKSNISAEIDCLLGCLEETSNNLLSERILRLLMQMRHTSAGSLKRSMMNYRYLDTTILSIWLKKGVSLEVKGNAFKLLLWMLNAELHSLPANLYELRRNVRFVSLVQASSHGRKLKIPQSDINRIKQGLAQLNEESRGLSKIWRNLWMLAEVLDRGFADETWGICPVMLPAMIGSEEKLASQDLLNLISDISSECQRASWLYLPFLVPLLSRCTYDVAVKTMMIVNVEFKTDEHVIEAIMASESELWVSLFLKLTWMGCKRFFSSSGEMLIELETLADISAETFSIIAEYIMRMGIDEDSSFWSTVMDSSHQFAKSLNNASGSNNFQFIFMRRAMYLVLQRIVKTNEEGWNPGLVQSINIVLDLISKHDYHKFPSMLASSDFLLDVDEQMQMESRYQSWTFRESEQLLYFELDLLNALLRISKKVILNGIEWFAMLRVYYLILDCMADGSEAVCERLLNEIFNFVLKASEPSAPFSDGEFMSLIVKTFQSLNENIFKLEFSNSKRVKFEGTVFRIIGHFTDLRLRLQDNYDIPQHVRKTIEALRIVSQMADIKMIFEVLEQTFKVSQPSIISFDDISADDVGAVTTSATDPSAFLDFTEVGEGALPPIDENHLSAEASSPAGIDSSPPAVADGSANEALSISNKYAKAFPQWLALRQGIISERVDTERARLTRAMTLQDMSSESTKKFWRRLRRKLEAEVFQESHFCQWKLGIAHEGPFFGRKRLIARPRYDNFYGVIPSPMNQRLDSSGIHDVDLSSDELNEALQKQYIGYIKDVTRSEGIESGDSVPADDTTESLEKSSNTNADNKMKLEDGYVDLPGGGWGVVGADGSEEGFGVVGVAQDFSPAVFFSDSIPANADTPVPENISVSTPVPKGKASGNSNTNEEVADKVRPLDSLAGADELYRSARATIETGPGQAAMFKSESLQKIEAKVVMITASGTCWGVLACNGEDLFFRSAQEQSEARAQDHASVNAAKDVKLRRRRWKVENISYIYLRRYRLRDSALEIFFRKGKHRSLFVDFGHTREDAKLRNEFAKTVSQSAPSSAFKQTPSMSAFRMVYEHDNIQEKWLQGKISNFDYLMALNTIAGRSFNDLCQYPVMPWVISDYSSPSINLNDSSVYRNLSKPMGALNPSRLKEFMDRFHSFEENVSSGIPAFMYGSHYSTMVGVVLHFLVRLQPFAALHQEMQNGHFDVPDRLFSSIPRSYAHNTNQLSEVKELIPEFFTNPDIFRNVNNFYFGETQDGENIENVELPPWAKTPEDFVRINREALESDFVSEHLHEWIDLIFGYKQRGPDAVEACNVFYYLTYYGSVDHYLITDEAVRKATELQIAHFGQTPMQLFKTPHPARRMHKIRHAPTYLRALKDDFSSISQIRLIEPKSDEEAIATEAPATLVQRNANTVVVALLIHLDRVTLILDTGVIDMVKYSASDDVKAVLQAAKEAAKEEAQQAAAIAASGGISSGRYGNRRASAQSSSPVVSAASTDTVGSSSASASNFPEDFLFPPSSNSTVSSADSRRPRGFSASATANTGNLTEDLLGLEGSNSMDSSTSSATSTVGHVGNHTTPSRQFFTLQDGDSLFFVEREVHHFDTLPRLPISKKLIQLRLQQRAQTLQMMSPAPVLDRMKLPMQPSETLAEAMTSLVVFSRNHLLALTIGAVDGTIHVRELDPKYGAIKSAADFCVHRSRVVSASIDQNGREYHLVASLDEQGTIFVWTIYAPKNGATSGANNGTDPNNAGGAAGARNGGSGKDSGKDGGVSASAATGSGGNAMHGANASGTNGGTSNSSNTNGSNAATLEQEYFARLHSYTIGRRPQRRFHIASGQDMRVDVSWAMGLVVAISGLRVHLFSVERDELLRTFDVQVIMPELPINVPSKSADASEKEPSGLHLDTCDSYCDREDENETSDLPLQEENHRECSSSGPLCNLFAFDHFQKRTTGEKNKGKSANMNVAHFMRRFVVSDFGMLVVHVESTMTVESLLEYEDSVVHVHRLVAHTISGQVTAVVQALSPITCLVCPDRGEVIAVGHKDGTVVLYRAQNLQVLYLWQPEPHCVTCPLLSVAAATLSSSASTATASATSGVGAMTRSGKHGGQVPASAQAPSQTQQLDTSPIITITFGPSPANPAVMILTTEAGNLYFKALPDFVRWERNRNPTVLQIASEQLQAVKGTILQAQNWGAETAGILAQNAMAELKKIRNNSLVKGVFGFFGASGDHESGSNNNNASNSNTNANNNSSKSAKRK